MTKPSRAFVEQIAQLRDVDQFTGVLQVHCHQGQPRRVDVTIPPEPVFVANERRSGFAHGDRRGHTTDTMT